MIIRTSFNASAAESISSSENTFNCSRTCGFKNEKEKLNIQVELQNLQEAQIKLYQVIQLLKFHQMKQLI